MRPPTEPRRRMDGRMSLLRRADDKAGVATAPLPLHTIALVDKEAERAQYCSGRM
jgi:hypothetical protein